MDRVAPAARIAAAPRSRTFELVAIGWPGNMVALVLRRRCIVEFTR